MNDFLISHAEDVGSAEPSRLARAICDRHTGIGADGWYILSERNHGEKVFEARLYNADGSRAELSGNGSRCVAAWLVHLGLAKDLVRLQTGAGLRVLELVEHQGMRYVFRMQMGSPVWSPGELRAELPLADRRIEVTVLNVGNPQCVVFVEGPLPHDWKATARQIERHPRFPERTNVSFVRPVDRHRIQAWFYERGAGETMSSGTGGAGAAVASILRGFTESPVIVETPGGDMRVEWDQQVIYVTGPAELVGEGVFFIEE